MRSANLLNDFAFKYVFGEDCKEANDALKSLLTVFLERKVEHVVVKNSEMVKDYTKMKSPRLDLLVEFDDQTSVDLEMQLRQTKDNLLNRFNYYLARLHGSQDMEGKSYSQLKETIVMVFFNLIIADDDDICSLYTMRKYSGIPLVKEEKEDRMKLMTIEMPKVDLHKPLEDMNEQEKMIYYFLNCHKGMDDSKIKMMIESDEVIQMLEKRVETISDDRWKKIIEDFQKLHENEERIERQLELEEAQKAKEEAKKALQEANKLKQEANKQVEEAEKKFEDANRRVADANKQVEEANKQTELETKRADVAEKQIQDMILRLSSTMDVKAMAILLNMSVDEIKKYI
jgi:predicted transposase/invertase (TIGR01784 family)